MYIKRFIKIVGYTLLLPLSYLIIALICSLITVNDTVYHKGTTDLHTIYLSTNGVHLDIILARQHLQNTTLAQVKKAPYDQYFAFGWGDEDFYINTPTWGDLKASTAFNALFMRSTTLMHVTRHTSDRADWTPIEINDQQLELLLTYISKGFRRQGKQIIEVKGVGYGARDTFYKANGSYSCIKTCNTWINEGLNQSGIKACLWTPFDRFLMDKHQID